MPRVSKRGSREAREGKVVPWPWRSSACPRVPSGAAPMLASAPPSRLISWMAQETSRIHVGCLASFASLFADPILTDSSRRQWPPGSTAWVHRCMGVKWRCGVILLATNFDQSIWRPQLCTSSSGQRSRRMTDLLLQLRFVIERFSASRR